VIYLGHYNKSSVLKGLSWYQLSVCPLVPHTAPLRCILCCYILHLFDSFLSLVWPWSLPIPSSVSVALIQASPSFSLVHLVKSYHISEWLILLKLFDKVVSQALNSCPVIEESRVDICHISKDIFTCHFHSDSDHSLQIQSCIDFVKTNSNSILQIF